MLNLFQHLFRIGFRNKFGMTRNQTVLLNSFPYLFRIRFRNPLELLFHTTQSLILFALQIFFAMLRATSSFGLRPHSTQNSQIRNDEKPKPSCWTCFSISSILDSKINSKWLYTGLPQIYFVNFRNDSK